MKKPVALVTRGKWEATLRNIRAMKNRIDVLDRRAKRHERALRYLRKKD